MDKDKDEIKERIIAGCERALGRPLPPFLTTKQVVSLGARSKDSLDRDSSCGTGLLPMPSKPGRGRIYLADDVINFIVGGEKQRA